MLELGAGDGTLMLGVARSLKSDWPAARLVLLDRQDLVSASTLAGYAELGWQASVDEWLPPAALEVEPPARADIESVLGIAAGDPGD